MCVWTAYIKSSQNGQVEGHELQGDDTEDALQAVHNMWQLDGLVGVLSHLRVVLATNDDGPPLMERATSKSINISQPVGSSCYICCSQTVTFV